MWPTLRNNANTNIRCHLRATLLLCFTWALLLDYHSTAASFFEGEPCTLSDLRPGICTKTSRCPEVELAVKKGELLSADITRCGFDTYGELICCPSGGPVGQPTPTPPITERVIFEATTTTTTVKPDFWLHLLNTTKAPTTILKPLIIGDKELDAGSEFFDFSTLLTTPKVSNTNRQMSKPQKLQLQTQIADSTTKDKFRESVGGSFDSAERHQRNMGIDGPMQQNRPSREQGFNHFNQNPNVFGPSPPAYQGDLHRNFDTFSNNPNFNFNSHEQNERLQQNQRHAESARENQRWHNNNEQPTSLRGQQQNSWGVSMEERNPTSTRLVPIWPTQMQHNNERFVAPLPLPLPVNNNNWDRNHNAGVNFAPHTWTNMQHNTAIRRPTTNDLETAASNHQAVPFTEQQIWSSTKPQTQNTFINAHAMPNSFNNNGIVHQQASDQYQPQQNRQFSFPTTIQETRTPARMTTSTTTTKMPPRTTLLDPFAPFEYRPQPVVFENDRNVNSWTSAGGANNVLSSTTKQKKPNKSPTSTTRLDDRPAVQACRIIDEGLGAALTTHILDGTPVELGEYPHMAAIGYSRIGNDRGPYDFRCGGTLIDKRFVLTAAHCVNSRDNQPAIVRLGVVNFTDEVQMRNAVEVPIERIHIHPEYTNSRNYHDISILQLERDVELSPNSVYPICLYTELPDPPANSWLTVAGWGTINTQTREFSNILLHARLEIVPLDSCNETYVENGLNRKIEHGLEQTQLCAHDIRLTKDACQGDSGGPLVLVVDQSTKKYRIVGIISAGFSCATSTPGLYTRIAAYLDFIEPIVWPALR